MAIAGQHGWITSWPTERAFRSLPARRPFNRCRGTGVYPGSTRGIRKEVATASGLVVVVTGASSGVGRATARAFGRAGAMLGLMARGVEGLDGVKKELDEIGVPSLAVPTDVADPYLVRQAALRIENELGPIAVWVNDAMVTVFSPLESITPEEFRRVTDVTYLGAVYGTMEALRLMKPRDRGVIVQVGSALSYRAIPLQSAYSGAKHALRGFTDSLRCELMHEGSNVRVTMVQLRSTSRNWRPMPSSGRASTRPARSTSGPRPRRRSSRRSSGRASWTDTSAGRATTLSRPSSRRIRIARTTCSRPCRSTWTRTGASTIARTHGALNGG